MLFPVVRSYIFLQGLSLLPLSFCYTYRDDGGTNTRSLDRMSGLACPLFSGPDSNLKMRQPS